MESGNALHLALAGLAILLLLSLCANLWQAWQNQGLAGQLAALNQTYAQASAQWERQQASLEGRIDALSVQAADQQVSLSALQYRLNNTQASLDNQTRARKRAEEQLNASKGELASQKQSLQNLTAQFRQLQADLTDSMGWFRENAVLPQTNAGAKNLGERVMEDCVDNHALNLACVNYVLERTATITYRTDPPNSMTGTADHLQSVEQTFAAGSGDCEDYSLLLKAIINTARGRDRNLTLTAWGAGSGRFQVYPKASLTDVEKYWYYDGAQAVDMGPLGDKPVWVVCFPYLSQGHCTVAVGGRITDSGVSLAGAQVFEPQDGQYMGTVGQEFSVCAPERQSNCWSMQRNIILMVTDWDLYKVQGAGWTSYGQLYEELMTAVPAQPSP